MCECSVCKLLQKPKNEILGVKMSKLDKLILVGVAVFFAYRNRETIADISQKSFEEAQKFLDKVLDRD